MNSKEIVSEFMKRADEHGFRTLTKKQCSWLDAQLVKEGHASFWTSKHHATTVWGLDGKPYHFMISKNGGGYIKVPTQVESLTFHNVTGFSAEQTERLKELAAKLRDEGNVVGAEMIEGYLPAEAL